MNHTLFDIPIYLIRQHLFCPRIPFFLEIQKRKPILPLWVTQGSYHHDKQKKLMNRRTLARFGLENADTFFDVPLSSEEYNFHGIADAVIVDEKHVYPIEHKLHGKHPAYSQIMQLVAYAILAEKKYKRPCTTGFILFENRGKTHSIQIDMEKRNKLLGILQIIRNNLEGVLPSSSASMHQCSQCEFLTYCNDRE